MTGYSDAAISAFSITAGGVTFTNANIRDLVLDVHSAAVFFSQDLSNGSTPSMLMQLASGADVLDIGQFTCTPCQLTNQLSFNRPINRRNNVEDTGTVSAHVSAFLQAFSAFSAKLEIEFGRRPNHDSFELKSEFVLGSASNGINPVTEPVTLQVGAFTATIPPGSFKGKGFGPFEFEGVIAGVRLEVVIKPTGANRYAFNAEAHRASLTGTKNPVTVMLTIGDDSGMTSAKAEIDRDRDHEAGGDD